MELNLHYVPFFYGSIITRTDFIRFQLDGEYRIEHFIKTSTYLDAAIFEEVDDSAFLILV